LHDALPICLEHQNEWKREYCELMYTWLGACKFSSTSPILSILCSRQRSVWNFASRIFGPLCQRFLISKCVKNAGVSASAFALTRNKYSIVLLILFSNKTFGG